MIENGGWWIELWAPSSTWCFYIMLWNNCPSPKYNGSHQTAARPTPTIGRWREHVKRSLCIQRNVPICQQQEDQCTRDKLLSKLICRWHACRVLSFDSWWYCAIAWYLSIFVLSLTDAAELLLMLSSSCDHARWDCCEIYVSLCVKDQTGEKFIGLCVHFYLCGIAEEFRTWFRAKEMAVEFVVWFERRKKKTEKFSFHGLRC